MLQIPLYNQLNDPLADGQQDPQAPNDCGPECLAMIGDAFGFGGVSGYSAGQIRVIIRQGQTAGSGLTTGDDLVYGLKECFQLPAHTRTVNYITLQLEVMRAIAARLPTIVLGYWESPTVLHWVVPVGLLSNGLLINDPWGGRRYPVPWGTVANLYGGQYVHLDQVLPGV